jgi:hypothetical protein
MEQLTRIQVVPERINAGDVDMIFTCLIWTKKAVLRVPMSDGLARDLMLQRNTPSRLGLRLPDETIKRIGSYSSLSVGRLKVSNRHG